MPAEPTDTRTPSRLAYWLAGPPWLLLVFSILALVQVEVAYVAVYLILAIAGITWTTAIGGYTDKHWPAQAEIIALAMKLFLGVGLFLSGLTWIARQTDYRLILDSFEPLLSMTVSIGGAVYLVFLPFLTICVLWNKVHRHFAEQQAELESEEGPQTPVHHD